MKTKLSPKFWLALTLFSLIGQVAWVVENMYFNVFIYKMFNASAENISLMVSASAVAATLTTIFMGALSDRIGKRKIFICGGYIAWGISIFSFAFLRLDIIKAIFPMTASAAATGVSLVIIMDCVMTFFGSTANDAAFNAWLTDTTDSSNRGAVEGINAMMPLVAILVVFGGFMFFNFDKPTSWTIIFTVIGAVVFIIGVLGCFIVKDPDIKRSETGYTHNIIYSFKPSSVKANPMLYLTLLTFTIFNISIQIFMPYLILYYEVALKMGNYVLIMAPAIIIASIVTALWGKVYDSKGFKFSSLIAIFALIIGYIVLFNCFSTVLVFIGSLLMMCGYLCGMAVFGAMIRDNVPKGKAGMLQGIRIFSQVLIPGIIGPFIGSAVLRNAEQIVNNDGTSSFVPNENIFLAALIAAVLVLPLLLLIFSKQKPRTCELKTPFEKNLTNIPWAEYPRPQLKRDSYFCLNGKWSFSVKHKGKVSYLGDILVPFCPESRLSGIKEEFGKKDILIYKKSFTLPKDFIKDKTILHFGAVDQYCRVYLNGKEVGSNVGGYIPFSFDISNLLNDYENELLVEVKDPLDYNLPYGKQRKKRGGMWYTPASGIWQTLWLESVTENYIKNIKVTPTLNSVEIEVLGGEENKQIVFNGKTYEFNGNKYTLNIDNPINWLPQNPHIYEFSVISGKDKVDSYFALRTVEIKKGKILLNGKPYFFHGLLDQGYFSDGIYLPATAEGFKKDILTMKKLGFNTLRKHIKIEPDLFYYYCDIYGMIVFQDIVNSGRYSFLIDTALPTVFLKKGVSHYASKKRKEIFEKSAKDTVELLYNHPSICYYTLFNEGWGQYDTNRIYNDMKSLDNTRVWDASSGWFETKKNDVVSEHIYFKPIRLKHNQAKPLILSEFGGYSCKIKDHSFNLDKTYGYRFFEDVKEFNSALIKLYTDEVIPAIENGLCATVLTQVSDVEDETNGLLTYDRQVLKVDEYKMNDVSEKLYSAFNKVN